MDNEKLILTIYKTVKKNPTLEGWNDLFQLLRHEDEDSELFKALVLELKDYAPMRLAESVNAGEVEGWYRLYMGSLYLSARWDVDSYFLYTERNREPKNQFYLPRRDFIQPLVQGFQDLMDGKLDVLTISCPPGIGKTTAALMYISMLLGRYPENQILAVGHTSKLVNNFYDGVTEMLFSSEYDYKGIFPESPVVRKSALDMTIEIGRQRRLKSLTCRSIEGDGLTGVARCNGLLYCDDLVSGIDQAMSITQLDKLYDRYLADVKTRKKEGCAELHIATRWSVHDVIGRLEREYEGNPRFRSVVMDCYDANGESKFEYPYGVGFSTEYFKDMENTMDDVTFRALYRNQPIEREGLLYPIDSLRRFTTLPIDPEKHEAGLSLEESVMEPDAILSIVDSKDKGADYLFAPIVYVYGNDYYVVDCVCTDGVSELESLVASKYLTHGVNRSQVESNSAGGKFAEILDDKLQKLGAPTQITTKSNQSNKETRIIVFSDWVKKHCLFLAPKLYAPKSDYGVMMSQLTSYTQKGKNAHDDVPDGMAQFAQFADNLSRPTVSAVQNPLWSGLRKL